MTPEYEKQRNVLNTTLGLAFCKLMEEHPLYDHRTVAKTGPAVLSVVLVGRGQPLELLRDKVLSNGQLLDTKLTVTMVSNDPKADMENLMVQAPELYRFIRIAGPVHADAPEWDLGTLHYEPCTLNKTDFTQLLEQFDDCTYFLFSADQEKLAKLCAKETKRVVACIREEEAGKDKKGTPIVQHSLELLSPKHALFTAAQGDEFLKKIEPIAYNLHYAYMKGNDPRATSEEINRTFLDPYNYNSNIECAVHLRSKLRCCGIANKSDNVAALRFAKELEYDRAGVLVERLACLEHQRWCISKLVQGFHYPEDLNLIYSEAGVNTHSKEKKWHACLVPSAESRPLTEADWIAPDPETIPGLDDLDRQTLRIHQICGSLLESAGIQIQEQMDVIRETLKAQVFSKTRKIGPLFTDLASAITKLQGGNIDALFLYRRSIQNWNDLLKKRKHPKSGEFKDPESKAIKEALDKLSHQMEIWIEYVTRKDYKSQDRTQIRQIPFVLSKWQDLTLVKLMTDRTDTCVGSAWEIEPSRLVFVDLAETTTDILRLRKLTGQIDHFLSENCKEIQVEYHFFICGDLLKFGNVQHFSEPGHHVHQTASADPDHIRADFVALMKERNADYIDVTDGKPELVDVAAGYAQNSTVGAFTVRNEHIQNFYGAEALHGIAMKRGFTVKSVFDHSGALKTKSDTEKLTGRIDEDYLPFWCIAHAHAPYWHDFCMSFVSKVREKARTAKTPDKLLLPQTHCNEVLKTLKTEVQPHIQPILDQMVAKKLITKERDGYRVTSEALMAALVNSGKVLEYFLYFSARKCSFTDVQMSYQFKHSAAKNAVENELDVICTKDVRTLFISAKNVKAESSNSPTYLKQVCYEVDVLASRFGINPKRILAAPNANQFENGKLSVAADYCMQRGVYLLGKECCQPDTIVNVLEKIMAGDADWCEHLLPQPVGTK